MDVCADGQVDETPAAPRPAHPMSVMTQQAQELRDELVVQVDPDGVAVVTLNRPERLNALTHDQVVRLRRNLLTLAGDPGTRAVVITGAGRAFCAGADLAGGPSDAEETLRRYYNPLIAEMRDSRIPFVAAVNGIAAGAGVSLALACDLRVVARSAKFQMSFVKVGLVPDAGATWLLPRLIGESRASQMLLLAEPVLAEQALAWGLANDLADDGATLDAAIALARRLAGLSSTVGDTKRLLTAAPARGLGDQLDAEARTQGIVQHGLDFQATRAAFQK